MREIIRSPSQYKTTFSHNFTDLRFKAHIKHAISFIKDDEFQMAKIDKFVHKIKQSSGRCDQNITAFPCQISKKSINYKRPKIIILELFLKINL